MHPALPSGVHLKALETYDIIFRCMGTNRLACELFIYSSGEFCFTYIMWLIFIMVLTFTSIKSKSISAWTMGTP